MSLLKDRLFIPLCLLPHWFSWHSSPGPRSLISLNRWNKLFLKYSWFTMLCQFLLYSKVTPTHIYIHSLSCVIFHHGLSQETGCSSLCCTVGLHCYEYGTVWKLQQGCANRTRQVQASCHLKTSIHDLVSFLSPDLMPAPYGPLIPSEGCSLRSLPTSFEVGILLSGNWWTHPEGRHSPLRTWVVIHGTEHASPREGWSHPRVSGSGPSQNIPSPGRSRGGMAGREEGLQRPGRGQEGKDHFYIFSSNGYSRGCCSHIDQWGGCGLSWLFWRSGLGWCEIIFGLRWSPSRQALLWKGGSNKLWESFATI